MDVRVRPATFSTKRSCEPFPSFRKPSREFIFSTRSDCCPKIPGMASQTVSGGAESRKSWSSRPKPNQTGTATVVTTYSFDKLHRMTGISYNDGSTPPVALSYDQSSVSGINLTNYLGQATNAVAANGSASTIFTYDTMGRVTEDWRVLSAGLRNRKILSGIGEGNGPFQGFAIVPRHPLRGLSLYFLSMTL
jgi:hypothetical protein